VLVWSKKVKDRNLASKLEYKIKRIGKEKKEELVKKRKIKNLS
jgi:predicted GIY-YIG superfamily endonuclease